MEELLKNKPECVKYSLSDKCWYYKEGGYYIVGPTGSRGPNWCSTEPPKKEESPVINGLQLTISFDSKFNKEIIKDTYTQFVKTLDTYKNNHIEKESHYLEHKILGNVKSELTDEANIRKENRSKHDEKINDMISQLKSLGVDDIRYSYVKYPESCTIPYEWYYSEVIADAHIEVKCHEGTELYKMIKEYL